MLKIWVNSLRSAWSNRKLITVYWLLTLLISFPGYWGIHRTMTSYFDITGVPRIWQFGWDTNYLLEMLTNTPFGQTMSSLMSGVILLGVVLYLALSGSVIGFLRNPEKLKWSAVDFKFAGIYFFRFFRVMLLTILTIGVSGAFVMIPVVGVIIAGLFILFFIVHNDVVKIFVVKDESHSIFGMYFKTLGWTVKNFAGLGINYLLTIVFTLVAFGVYLGLDHSFEANSGLKIFMMFMIQQGWIWFRSAMKIQILMIANAYVDAYPKQMRIIDSIPAPLENTRETPPAMA